VRKYGGKGLGLRVVRVDLSFTWGRVEKGGE